MKTQPKSNEEADEKYWRGQSQTRIQESPQEISDSQELACSEDNEDNAKLGNLSKRSERSSQNFVIQEAERESGGSQSNERPMTEIKFKNLTSSKISSMHIGKSSPKNGQEIELLIQKTRSNQSVDKR